MKNTSKLLLVLGSFTLGFFAPAAHAHGDHSAGGNTPEARANRLEEQLGLTEDQAKQIEAVFTEEAAAIKAIRDQKLEPKAAREQIKKVRADYRAKLTGLLTPEQKAKLEAQQKEGAGGPK